MSTRSYLSIGDVLSLLREEFPDVTISKIRFLESQGLVDPERSPSGYRKFYDHDVERLRWVLRQQRDQFLPLKVIRDRLAAAGNGVPPDEPDETPGPGRGAGGPAGEQKGEVWANGATASPSVGGSPSDSGTGPEPEEHGRGGSVDERYEAQRGNVVRFDAERRQPASVHPASGAHWPVRPGASPSPTPSVGASAEPPGSTGTPAGAQIGANAPGALPGSTELAPARQSASVPAAAGDTGSASGRGDRVDAEMRTRTPGLFADVAARGGGPGPGTGRRPADVGSAEAVHGGVPGVAASAEASAPSAGAAAAGEDSSGASPAASGAGRATGAAGVTPATSAAAMGDRVRDGGERAIRPPAGSPGSDAESAANMLTGSVSGVSLTLTELSAATGLSPQALATLESFGLIAPMAIAGDTFYDEEALTAAKLVAEFAKFGIEPRHLRLYRNAVDREAGLVEQVITPLLRQRNPESRQRAMDAAAELTRLGQGLHAALVRAELRRQFGG